MTKVGVSLRQYNDITAIDIFNEKRKFYSHQCPDSIYFHMLFLIIYLRAIKTLICCREMSLIGSTSFGFCTKDDTWFSKYRIELKVPLSSTNATKKQ